MNVYSYLDVENKIPLTKPNVESATNMDIIQEQSPNIFSANDLN